MNQVRYMISDAARLVEVESHVLRYWEEELELPIARNEMGHRYYTEDDIQLLKHIKTLKERGYQLKAIKMDISENGELLPQEETLPQTVVPDKADVIEDNQEKMKQFQSLLSRALGEALRENREDFGSQIADRVTKEMNYQLRLHEEQQEEHLRKLDESIRMAVGKRKEKVKKEKPEKKRRVFFGKKEKLRSGPVELT